MLRALLHSCDDPKSASGACWILALDGILLIPVLFAAFFYPMAALASVAVMAVLTLVTFGVVRAVHTHRHRHGL